MCDFYSSVSISVFSSLLRYHMTSVNNSNSFTVILQDSLHEKEWPVRQNFMKMMLYSFGNDMGVKYNLFPFFWMNFSFKQSPV